MVSDLTSLKAGLVANPYTKKQNICRNYKCPKEQNLWNLEHCPSVSVDVRLCRKFLAEFLTKNFFNLFFGMDNTCKSSSISDALHQIFSLAVRFYAGFFVILGKHNGRYYPTDVLKTVKSMSPIDNRASKGLHFIISY